MRLVLAVGFASLAIAPFAHGSSVIVPDDFATIQMALDSGADSVFIRAGVYPERPAVPREVHLVQGLPENGVRPRIAGLHVCEPCYFQSLLVAGCSFTGGVLVDDGCGLATVRFESCDLDSGLVNEISDVADFAEISIRHSRIAGPVVLRGSYSACEADTFVGAGVRFTDEASGLISDCVFTGPGNRAIQHATYSSARILRNTITGFSVGLAVTATDGEALIEGNEIIACGTGMMLEADHRVRVLDNRVLDCGTGIRGQAWSGRLDLHGNLVLGSTDLGLDLVSDSGADVIGNVIGRSGGDGIRVEVMGGVTIERNTAFRNGASGISLVGPAAHPADRIAVSGNIGYENDGYGLESGPAAITSGCNDWFGNTAGATFGLLPSSTDLAVDPLFCDVDHDSVTLFASSPLANAPGCGLVGARGVGCDVAAVPGGTSTSHLQLAPVVPNPSSGAVRIRWSLPRQEWVEVSLHDLAGRVVAVLAHGVRAAGVQEVTWDGRRGGAPAPAGVYFVRLRSGESNTTRSFLVRR